MSDLKGKKMANSKKVTFRIPVTFYEKIKIHAELNRMTLSDVIMEILRDSEIINKEKKPLFNDHFYNSLSVVTEIMYSAFFDNLREEEKNEIIKNAKERTEKMKK